MSATALPTLAPMLAYPADPFSSAEYLYEPKWDGFRCLIYVENNTTQLRSRNGADLTSGFPELAMIHRQIRGAPAILDGEIVIFQGGKEHFHLLLPRMHHRPRLTLRSGDVPALLIVFDLLYSQGKPLLDMPLQDRKTHLVQAVTANEHIIVNGYITQAGEALFDAAVAQGREGIMAKHLHSLYSPGKRSRQWLKIKPLKTTEAVVIGYIPKGNDVFVSLALGQYLPENGPLIYVGNVGTGFTEAIMQEILDDLQPLPLDATHLVQGVPEGYGSMIWVVPKMVVEVRYLEYTPAGSLRHPGYRRQRHDIEPQECVFPAPRV